MNSRCDSCSSLQIRSFLPQYSLDINKSIISLSHFTLHQHRYTRSDEQSGITNVCINGLNGWLCRASNRIETRKNWRKWIEKVNKSVSVIESERPGDPTENRILHSFLCTLLSPSLALYSSSTISFSTMKWKKFCGILNEYGREVDEDFFQSLQCSATFYLFSYSACDFHSLKSVVSSELRCSPLSTKKKIVKEFVNCKNRELVKLFLIKKGKFFPMSFQSSDLQWNFSKKEK